jgi:hypothetical protein
MARIEDRAETPFSEKRVQRFSEDSFPGPLLTAGRDDCSSGPQVTVEGTWPVFKKKQKNLNPKEHHVKSRTALLLGIVLRFGTTVFAQDNPKIEVSANYSYMRFNPQNNNLPGLSAFSLNGGGGAFSYFLTDMIGIRLNSKAMAAPPGPSPMGFPFRVTSLPTT